MRTHFRLQASFFALTAILLFSTAIFASLDRGQVQGTVTDPQGAVVPGVTVVVTNVDTGIKTKLVTNSTGFYLAPDLVPGKYNIR
ncbi:MAG: carboxypeptidase regulatory-like domain-containing protein, partial [Terriglobia bacterium]